jgi:acyl-CoA synthetase (AMP-forming)/AMP-acid ligase II
VIAPFTERTIGSFLERAVDVSAEPLHERPFGALAEEWRASGLSPGHLVVLALPTGVALLHHFFGVIAAGGVPALVAPGAPAARLVETARRLGARAVAALRLPRLDGAERGEPVGSAETAWFSRATRATSAGEVVMMTSGTSGFASGCVTTLDAMRRNAERHADSVGQRADDTVLVGLPLHFSFALVAQAIATLARGGTLVIAGPPFNPSTYASTVTGRGVSVSSLTPVQVRALLNQRTQLPRSLRVLSVGGDSLAPEHVAELLRRRPGGELYLTYGLTQAGPRVSTLAAHRAPPRRQASVGLPLAGTDVRLEDLGDGTGRTELLVASDTVMRRRIGLVEGRRGDELRADGFLATGDVFTEDPDGYLYYRGRLTEYLVSGGEKISLATVRRVATGLPGVLAAQARAAGAAGFDLTLVVANRDVAPAPEHYRALLSRSLRRAELPRSLDVVDQATGYK